MYCVKDKLPPYDEEEDAQIYWGYYIIGNTDSYNEIEDIETEYGFVSYYGNDIWKDKNWKNVQVLYWTEIPTIPDNYKEYLKELFEHRHDKFTVVLVGNEFYYVDLNTSSKKRIMYPVLKYDSDPVGSIILENDLPYKVIEQNPTILQKLEYITYEEYLKIIT